MMTEEPAAPEPVGVEGRRDRLLARREARLRRLLASAEQAVRHGDHRAALRHAADAGLLDPEHPRVTAVLERAQRALSARVARHVAGPPPASSGAGPASWTVPAARPGSPRRASGLVSGAIAVAAHAAAGLAIFVALAQVVPALDIGSLAVMRVPSSFTREAPPSVGDVGGAPEDGGGEEAGTEIPAVIATASLADLPSAAGRGGGLMRGTRSGLVRGVRRGGGAPSGSPPAGGATTGGTPGSLLGSASVDRPPRLTRAVPPLYPEAAFARGLAGVMTVTVEVVLNRSGRVERTRAVEGEPELRQAAEDAVAQWVYTPAVRHGQRVPVIFTVSITFDFR